MDKSFYEARVEVPKLSGFDKSFQNLYTAPVGTIVPALFDEIVAGSVIDLDMAASCSLPPLASDTFMQCSLKVEAFFVPMRLCYGGFEHFFVGDEFEAYAPGSGSDSPSYQNFTITKLPSFRVYTSREVAAGSVASVRKYIGAGSLLDFLGFKTGASLGSNYPLQQIAPICYLPLIAYHKCFDDWYRNSLIQRSCFAPPVNSVSMSATPVSALPYYTDVTGLYSQVGFAVDSVVNPGVGRVMADGHNFFFLRQRNFGFDYFTCATPSPQNGEAARVTLDANNLSDGFTISQLRSMNSLQQFRERNNLAGDRYVDRLFAQYGCRPSDGIAQRVLCLASGEFEVYSKGIFENSNNPNSGQSANPFGGQLGSRGGSASAGGRINICHGFRAAEPGYLFVMTSLVPRVTYAMGLSPALTRYCADNSIGEMANPILQNVGPEPIYTRELIDSPGKVSETDVFGYTDRYGSFKARFNELHGLLREGESLSSFAAQRYLDTSSDPRIDNEFLQIPTDYLDNVTAVSASLSEYGVWCDTYFKYRVSMPLARYSLPTLQDPAYEHGKSITLRRGGFRF